MVMDKDTQLGYCEECVKKMGLTEEEFLNRFGLEKVDGEYFAL